MPWQRLRRPHVLKIRSLLEVASRLRDVVDFSGDVLEIACGADDS